MPLGHLEDRCKQRKYSGAKITALYLMSSLLNLIKQGVKVIHLVRDPRSAWLSRAKFHAIHLHKSWDEYLKYVQDHLMENPDLLDDKCVDLEKDLSLLKDFHNRIHSEDINFLDNYKIVRFEDIALNPTAWAKSMYNFLEIPIHKNVLNWIKTHTKITHNDSSR